MRQIYLVFLFIFSSVGSNAQLLYHKCIQSCTPSGAYKTAMDQVILSSTSDIVISGYGALNFQGYFISKNDSLNNFIWCREIEWTIRDTLFGLVDTMYQRKRKLYKTDKLNENSIIFSMEQDSVVYSLINPTPTFARWGLKSSILSMVDINGNLVWSKILNSDKHNQIRYISSLNDRIYFGGVYSDTYFSGSQQNHMIICTDTLGSVLWNVLIPNSSSRNIVTIKSFHNNGVLILSNDTISTYLLKIDNNGSVSWSYNYSNYFKLQGIDMEVKPDSTILLLANNEPNSSKACLMKLDSLGNLLWSKSYSSSLVLYPKQIVESRSDTSVMVLEQYGNSPRKVVAVKIYPSGNIINSIIFFQNTSSSSSNPPSSSYNYLRFLNKQGINYIGNIDGGIDMPVVGLHAEFVNTIRFDKFMSSCSHSNYYTGISFSGITINKTAFPIIDSSAIITSITYPLSLQPATYPLVNYCNSSVALNEYDLHDLNIFPNPTNGRFTISIPENIRNCQLEFYNQNGQMVYQIKENNPDGQISIELSQNMANGVYEIKALLDESLIHSKLILIKN